METDVGVESQLAIVCSACITIIHAVTRFLILKTHFRKLGQMIVHNRQSHDGPSHGHHPTKACGGHGGEMIAMVVMPRQTQQGGPGPGRGRGHGEDQAQGARPVVVEWDLRSSHLAGEWST